jgi:glutamine synthetase type III
MNFMKELEIECMKLGIPVTTRHNEVAPNQFELAPMFEEVNVAVDHNSLLMDVMARIAHNITSIFYSTKNHLRSKRKRKTQQLVFSNRYR